MAENKWRIRTSRGRKQQVVHETHDKSVLSVVADNGVYYRSYETTEDKSLEKKHHLTLFGGKGLLINHPPAIFGSKVVVVREGSKSKRRIVDITGDTDKSRLPDIEVD